MIKIIRISGIFLLLFILGGSAWVFQNLHNRHPDYQVDLSVNQRQDHPLKVGFAAVRITPWVPDQWSDLNQDALYNPADGDRYTDGNGNGKFDAVWMAGFHNKRPANGIHDDLWARTVIIDNGNLRISITVLDAIGFMHDDIVDVRKKLPAETGITYSIISSTHTHEAPDLLGLWGKSHFSSGMDPTYMQFVKEQCVRSITVAYQAMKPAWLVFAQDLTALNNLVADTRDPQVLDHGLRLILALDAENGNPLGSVVSWANHPETLWSKNLLITSDFPHFVREGLEKGISLNDSLVMKGLGGIAIYFNGAIGGLMTTPPDFEVTDPMTKVIYKVPSFQKARAQGTIIAQAALNALKNDPDTLKNGSLSIIAKTIDLPLDNPLFRLGTSLGILDRGLKGWMKVQSEISVLTLGPASFITIPGEIYPEIINGGIEAPAGRDYEVQPVEIPPLRDQMPGKYKFVLGMTNDMIGYIIPKSEWDEGDPYMYQQSFSPYGEVNSLGPETAPILHGELTKIITLIQN